MISKEYHKKYFQDNKDRLQAKNKEWRLSNLELSNQYSKKWREANKEKRREYEKEYRRLNKEKESLRQKSWRLDNPDKHNAREAKRRATKLNATPKWITDSQLSEIKDIYMIASELSWLSEGGLHVDHIEPLKGKDRSGLHVPWNLQIIPAPMNLKKGNRV